MQEGNTLLHLACYYKQEELVEHLLHKAIVREGLGAFNEDGFTPLHIACQSGTFEIVSSLLQHKADVHCQTRKFLWRPIHLAAESGNDRVVELLLEHGCGQYANEVVLVYCTA
jgi:ankyrin repeat and protein kinase domain-containing protein 1